MSPDTFSFSGDRCLDAIRSVARHGIRFAGTKGERKAADWIEAQFNGLGLDVVRQQGFPCKTFSCEACILDVRFRGGWERVASEAAAHSGSTPPEGLTAPLLWLEKIPSTQAECNRQILEKAVLVFSSLLFRPGEFRKVMRAQPAALLIVDDRIPTDWTVSVGFPRLWVDWIFCPILNVPFFTAWEMVSQGAVKVRVQVQATVQEAESQNVIGEITGSEFPEDMVVVSAHHDSVMNNPGPDDNCSGVAAVLELARYFSEVRPRRTVRFISYGAEEQLSEGAKYHAVNTSNRSRIKFVLNVDAIGAHMGQTGIYYCGGRELTRVLVEANEREQMPVHLHLEPSPFSDHFPLCLAGIPAAWYYRTTGVAGRYYHHSQRERIEVISGEVLEQTVRHQAALLDMTINQDEVPFPRSIPSAQMKKLRSLGREFLGFGEFETTG
jgi:hypothetical protein